MNGRPEFTEEEHAVVYKACGRYAMLCANSVKMGIEEMERDFPSPSDGRAKMAEHAAIGAQEWADAESLLVKPVADYTEAEMASLQNALEVMVEYFIEDEFSAKYDDDGNLALNRDEDQMPCVEACAGMEPEEFAVYLERLHAACKKVGACTDIPYQCGRVSV